MSVDLTTLGFETINFLVLTLILWRVLYRPLRASVERRRAAIAEDRASAAASRERVERLEAEWETRKDELAGLRAEVRQAALDDADRERARILARAREDAEAERARVTQLLTSEREAAERWAEAAVWSGGTALAARLVLTLAPAGTLDDALFDRLLEVLAAHAPDLRTQAPVVELTGAHMAERPQIERLREAADAVLEGAPRLTVREDESLLAGWVLRVGDRVFDASLAGELDAFRELARGAETHPAAEGAAT